ncbi:MAG: hypothetical protein ABR543_07075 [Gemmatimonadaceae bacterium]
MVNEVQVVTRPPYAGGGRWWEFPLRLARQLHATTEESVIRRFLLLDVGMACNERRRAESERILRAQPFLAEASVKAVPDAQGGVTLIAETTDELTPVIVAVTKQQSPYLSALKLGDGNVGGSGTYAAVEWREGFVRDNWGARVVDHQFFGRMYVLELEAARRDLGTNWVADLGHPFFTELQRVAWRARAENTIETFGYLRPGEPAAQVTLERQFVDVGGVMRIGVPGRLSVFGVSFSRESDETALPLVIDSAVDYDALLANFSVRDNARVNAIWGVRNLSYRRVERFDAITAAQDVRFGFQLGTLFGRSLSVLGTTDDDILVAANMYGGVGSERTFMSLQARGEGRQNYDNNKWDGMIGGARLSLYKRLTDRNTIFASADWGAGWRVKVPFQLTMGDREGGVRGYRASHDAGGRRAAVRLEDRFFMGRMRRNADAGLAIFADAGKLWRGDVPFGVSTPVKFGAGIGLLAAFPAGSKRTWRLDLAYPLSPDGHAKFEVRLSSMDASGTIRAGWREPADLTRSREQSVPSSVYNWP